MLLRIYTLVFIYLFLSIHVVSADIGLDDAPANLWMGIIAEDSSGDINTYLAIASVARNRLIRGMDVGLNALKRKDLDEFVYINALYMRKVELIDLELVSQFAILQVFGGRLDYSNGADHYEHTGTMPAPEFTKKMRRVMVLNRGTSREITFWKERRKTKR